jgi:hypothetical protein
MNYFIKLNLLKIKSAVVMNITGKSATKKCLVIPIEDACLFTGEKGVYADFSAWEMRGPKGQDTHLIRQNLPKGIYEAMTEEEKNTMPIVGAIRPIAAKEPPVSGHINSEDIQDGDLPF